MRGVSNRAMDDLQTVHNLADILVDLCKEAPTGKLLEQINKNVKRIKKITKEYFEN
ncbi:hypothetical protein [Clostridium sp. CF012]|uniref:hypothetical protein n=1 Tax=Clostridium sp. CF012 TaxID=2843319 RepID=UPI001C0AA50F|nr:hypothetical protein [Clostridium sp. CF012]MBU3145744.1 hypothetical protein [Clostridium sp. CF012]